MNVTSTVTGDTCTITLEGDLNFQNHIRFREATRPALDIPGLTRLVLELGAVQYLDSSALGMLLLLREKAKHHGIKIILLHPTPQVLGILTVVQFSELFEIQN